MLGIRFGLLTVGVFAQLRRVQRPDEMVGNVRLKGGVVCELRICHDVVHKDVKTHGMLVLPLAASVDAQQALLKQQTIEEDCLVCLVCLASSTDPGIERVGPNVRVSNNRVVCDVVVEMVPVRGSQKRTEDGNERVIGD